MENSLKQNEENTQKEMVQMRKRSRTLLNKLTAMTYEVQNFRKSMNIKCHSEDEANQANKNWDFDPNGVLEDLKMKQEGNFQILESKKRRSKNAKKNLQQTMNHLRVKNIVDNFKKKMFLNNTYRDPVDFNPFEEHIDNSDQYNGLEIHTFLIMIFNLVSILNTLVMIVIFSMSIGFQEALESEEVRKVQIWGILWLLIEIGVNFVKISYGKQYEKLEKLSEIASQYMKGKFKIDAVCWIGLLIDIFFESEFTIIVKSLFLLKGWDCVEKIQTFENKFLDTTYKENCWGLVKIFLINFIIAHFLAIILIMISWLDSKHNWLSKVDAMKAPWIEQYCWAYYWGTTIMFTVGFGDISAVNHKEAMFVVFIQAFTCIYLAYNINCVGIFISNIRAEDVEKRKRKKILKQLSEKNNISEDLRVKISKYIEECSNIKKNFNIEEDSAFISSLPSQIKASFLRESNKKIFDNLPFFSVLTDSTLLKLAEKIEMSITHPEQVIERRENQAKILILKQGMVALCSKMHGSKYNNSVIDRINIKQGENPILLSLQFINPQNTKYYELHSKQYCIIYSMQPETLNQILKNKNRDHEYFCFLKDKSKHIIDEFQFKNCQHCDSKHFSFRCPKLHYIPLVQEVIFKYIKSLKVCRSTRTAVKRKKEISNAFAFFQPKKNLHLNQSEPVQEESSSIPPSNDLQFQFQQIKKSNIAKKEKLETERKKTLEKVQTKLMNDLVGQIKNELKQYFNQGQNPFWDLQTDLLKDYQFYFPQSNSKNYNQTGRKNLNKKKFGSNKNYFFSII